MRTLRDYIKTLPSPESALFNNELTYPAPFDVADTRSWALDSAITYYGGMAMDENIIDGIDIHLYCGIMAHQAELANLERIMEAYSVDGDAPDFVEERTYGQDVTQNAYGQDVTQSAYGQDSTTTNIGARSTTENLGATSGTQTNTGTAYDTVTGKETTKQTTATQAVQNGTSQAAASDSTTRSAHTDTSTRNARTDTSTRNARTDTSTRSQHKDTIERYNYMDEMDSADFIAKSMPYMNKAVCMMLAKIIVDVICIPYYPEV